MSFEHEKGKKWPRLLKKTVRLKLQKLVEQKLFAIMKGNFSALAVKRIREK
jgi:hypothetical protein